MDVIAGGIVTGENLYGRSEKLLELWDRISNGSILLSSPRRFGKTSLVHEMMRVPKAGWKVYYMEIEGTEDQEDFVIELMEKVDKNIKQKIKGVFVSLKDTTDEFEFFEFRLKLRRELKNDWNSKGKKIFEQINKVNNNTIIVLDELPTFLQNLEKKYHDDGKSIRLFLQWLRVIRQSNKIRFILCGSVGIDNLLAEHNLTNTINDLERIDVPPFTDDVAKGMIKKLLDRYDIKYENKHIDNILEEIGIPVPYFIQLFVKAILINTKYGKFPLTDEIIKFSYKKGVLGVQGQKDLKWYLDRLKIEFKGIEYRTVLKILDHLAKFGPTDVKILETIFTTSYKKNDKPLFLNLIRKLISGFYINKDEEKKTYSFHTKVLKDLWIEDRGLY